MANKYEQENAEFFANLFTKMEKEKVHDPFPMHSMAFPEEQKVKVYCKECERQFDTFYRTVQFCSIECGQLSLKKVGLDWRPKARLKEEQWHLADSGSVELKTLIAMKALLKKIEEKYELPGEWFEGPELTYETAREMGLYTQKELDIYERNQSLPDSE